MHPGLIATALSLVTPLSSQGYIYVGNPTLRFSVMRPEDDFDAGDVLLHQVKLHKCSGTTITTTPDVHVDPVVGWTMSFSGGDYCSVTFVWDSALEIESDTFVVEYDAVSTTAQFGATIAPVVLAPIDVVVGTYSGNAPRLKVEVH